MAQELAEKQIQEEAMDEDEDEGDQRVPVRKGRVITEPQPKELRYWSGDYLVAILMGKWEHRRNILADLFPIRAKYLIVALKIIRRMLRQYERQILIPEGTRLNWGSVLAHAVWLPAHMVLRWL